MLRWLRSALRGEVSTADLESRRRAGAIAYSLAQEAEGITETDRGARLFKLCAWNAFALQTIADTLIDCDAQDDPATAGYVPRSTLLYATACVDQVPRWISCARVVPVPVDGVLAAVDGVLGGVVFAVCFFPPPLDAMITITTAATTATAPRPSSSAPPRRELGRSAAAGSGSRSP